MRRKAATRMVWPPEIVEGRRPLGISGNQRSDSRLLNLVEPVCDVPRVRGVEVIAPDLHIHGVRTTDLAVVLGVAKYLRRPDTRQESARGRIVGIDEHRQHHARGAFVVRGITQGNHRWFLSAFVVEKVRQTRRKRIRGGILVAGALHQCGRVVHVQPSFDESQTNTLAVNAHPAPDRAHRQTFP